MNNFYICKTFFKYVVDTYIIMLIIKIVDCKNIEKFGS